MGRFLSPKLKSLRVADIGVQFVGGAVTVDDKHDERMRRLAEFGVVEDTSAAPPAATVPEQTGAVGAEPEGDQSTGDQSDGDDTAELSPPAGNASRDDWAAFAAKIGLEVDASEKRDDIRTRVEALLAEDEDDEDDDESDDTE